MPAAAGAAATWFSGWVGSFFAGSAALGAIGTVAYVGAYACPLVGVDADLLPAPSLHQVGEDLLAAVKAGEAEVRCYSRFGEATRLIGPRFIAGTCINEFPPGCMLFTAELEPLCGDAVVVTNPKSIVGSASMVKRLDYAAGQWWLVADEGPMQPWQEHFQLNGVVVARLSLPESSTLVRWLKQETVRVNAIPAGDWYARWEAQSTDARREIAERTTTPALTFGHRSLWNKRALATHGMSAFDPALFAERC